MLRAAGLLLPPCIEPSVILSAPLFRAALHHPPRPATYRAATHATPRYCAAPHATAPQVQRKTPLWCLLYRAARWLGVQPRQLRLWLVARRANGTTRPSRSVQPAELQVRRWAEVVAHPRQRSFARVHM